MREQLILPFGKSSYLLPGTKAAWGARLIVRQDGDVDFVPDRQGAAGDPELVEATTAWVNEVFDEAKANLSDGLRRNSIRTREQSPVWLFEDDKGCILGNTNASAGYFYVVAYLFEALPDGCTTKGADLLVEDLEQLREAEKA